MKPAILMLSDGTRFWGESVGLEGTSMGELCFNTGMTGYQEVFTDPSYQGQLLVMTTAHVGNYGYVNLESEEESDSIKIAGLICRNFDVHPSRSLSEGNLLSYFEKQNKMVIANVDTRAVVRYIRTRGAMNAIISTEVDDLSKLESRLDSLPSMEGLELASTVSSKDTLTFGDDSYTYKLAMLDVGYKRNIVQSMVERGCQVKVFSLEESVENIMEWKPDGVLISNGPGDPQPLTKTIDTIRTIITNGTPTFGICLGHQLISLALGISTYKMHNGHRGINHPILNCETGLGEITTQNHGFVVDKKQVEEREDLLITHLHLNDESVAGIRHTKQPLFSVQYHPEAHPGPHDSRYIFDEFIKLMNKN